MVKVILVVLIMTAFMSNICKAQCPSVAANGTLFTDPIQDTLSAKNTSEVLAYDFSSAWESQVLIDYRGASQRTDNLIGVKALAAETYHPDDEELMGIKIIGSDIWWITDTLLTKIASHLTVDNALPANAAELFPELGTPEGFAEFNALYPTQQLAQYGMAVNFATKRFYNDFTDPDWRHGGIYIQMLPRNSSGQFVHDDQLIRFGEPGNEESVDGACYFKVFSAAEGEVLYDDYFTYSTCSEQKAVVPESWPILGNS